MNSWEGIVEDFQKNVVSKSLDQTPPVKGSKMGLTISPPHFNYKAIGYDMFIYLYLQPLEYLILDKTLDVKVYPEFSKEGRLHFHIILFVPDQRYGEIYLLLNTLKYSYQRCAMNHLKVKSKLTKRLHIKRINRIAMVKPELCLHDEQEWQSYCEKEVEKTEKILGINCPINYLIFGKIRINIENKFSIIIV